MLLLQVLPVEFLSSHISHGVTQWFLSFILFIFNSQHHCNLCICLPLYLSRRETTLPGWFLKYHLCLGVSMTEWLCRLPLSFLPPPQWQPGAWWSFGASYLTFTWLCIGLYFSFWAAKSYLTQWSPVFGWSTSVSRSCFFQETWS